MPILEVEIVTPDGAELEDGLAARIADGAGEVFGSPPGRTWVKLHALPSSRYAENGGTPPGVYPVFVNVLKAEVLQEEELRKEARALAEVIGRLCQRPSENVHILYSPSALGRIAFGGNLLT